MAESWVGRKVELMVVWMAVKMVDWGSKRADQKVEQWVAQSERCLVEMKEFVGVDWLAECWALRAVGDLVP